MCCCAGVDEAGRPFAMADPVATQLRHQMGQAVRDPARLVDVLLNTAEIFGDDLPRDVALRSSLTYAVSLLQQRGASGAVAACLAGELLDPATTNLLSR